MKLFIVAALVSVAAAARLEHLEQLNKGYLPPDHSHGQSDFSHGSNGQGSHSFGSNSFGSFDSSAGARSQQGAFPGATLNQYLPPDHGPSDAGQFSGSLTGFQRSQQQYTPQSQFGSLGSSQYQNQNQYGAASSSLGQSRYNSASQFSSASRQYLAPKSSNNFQNIPQQAFDEQTGYHY